MKPYYILDAQKDELAQVKFTDIFAKICPEPLQSPNSYFSIDEDITLKQIYSKYPFFNSEISLFCIEGSGGKANHWPIHIDAGRRSALNIPILNCDMQSITYFYDEPSLFKNRLEVVPEYQISIVHGDLKQLDRFSLTVPTLINTSIPHAVHNNGSGYRVIMSWGSMLSLEDLVAELLSKRTL